MNTVSVESLLGDRYGEKGPRHERERQLRAGTLQERLRRALQRFVVGIGVTDDEHRCRAPYCITYEPALVQK